VAQYARLYATAGAKTISPKKGKGTGALTIGGDKHIIEFNCSAARKLLRNLRDNQSLLLE
jgi:hypothetical protein